MPAVFEERLEAVELAEVHWSTGTILALFFATTLVSAVFFGLGYSLGRGTEKPWANLGARPMAEPFHASATPQPAMPQMRAAEKPVRSGAGKSIAAAAIPAAAPVEKKVVEAASDAREVPAAATDAKRYMVQVGAIGNRKDAQRLVAELRKKGFRAAIYPGKHDKFLHVQIGPFSTLDPAQAMRHRVTGSGFHAILTQAS